MKALHSPAPPGQLVNEGCTEALVSLLSTLPGALLVLSFSFPVFLRLSGVPCFAVFISFSFGASSLLNVYCFSLS